MNVTMSRTTHRGARALATWFGCGRSPIAPGTVGTLGALPLWFIIRDRGPFAIVAASAIITIVGVWAAGVVARQSENHDPQEVVIDEVAGVLVALAAAPPTTGGAVAGVLLFRLFDVLKPFPAGRAERLPGGWGIVLDDVVAGMQAAIVVGILRSLGLIW